MKKLFYSVAAAALVLVASCAREVAPVVENEGGLADVTFNLSFGEQTKAISDGNTVDVLTVGVYDVTADAPVYLAEISGDESITAGRASFTKQLVKGEKYKLVLWAQNADAPYTATIDAQNASVSVNPVGDANDEARDAFWAVVETSEITEGYTQNITLKRAVAQINVLSTDYAAALAAGVSFEDANMKVANAPVSVNLLADELEVVESGDYDFAAVKEFDGALPGSNDKLLVTNYILAGDKAVCSVAFDVNYTVNGSAVKTLNFAQDNVPVQRNFQTNIAGNVFTATATFNISVDPMFGDPSFNEELKLEADNVDDVNQALIDNAQTQGSVSYTVGVVKSDNTTIEIPAGTAASDITINVASFDEGVATLTVADAGATAAYSGNIYVNLPADTNLDQIVINTPAAHVELSNGTVTKVIASTGGNTLVVGADVAITTLEILKGNVELAGAVESIVRGEGNTDEATYVTLVDGYSWKNQATDTAEGTKVIVKTDEVSEDPSVDPGASGTAVFDFTAATGTYAFENGVEVGSKTEAPITVTFAAGTNKNAPKYYTSGDAVRTYGGNTVTINGANISKVVFTFGASDGSNAILADSGELAENVWIGSATEIVFTIDGTSGNRRIAKIEVTYGEATPVDPSEDVSEDPVLKDIVAEVSVKAIEVKVGESSEAVVVTVTDPAEGATVVLASKNAEVATVADGVVTGVAVGETEITATITAEGYNEAVLSIPVAVTEATANPSEDPQPTTGSGTLEDPYTIAGVIAYIDGLNGAESEDVYVKGVVSELTKYAYGPTFNTASFWMTEDGNASDVKFEAYSCYYFGGATSKWIDGISTAIALGQEIVIYGKVMKYNTTYETASKKAQIYSIDGVTSDPAYITAADVKNVAAEGVTDATLNVTIANAEGYDVAVVPDGTVVTSASYAEGVVTYAVSANTSKEERVGTITITLTKTGAANVEEVINVAQLGVGEEVVEDPYEMGANITWTLGSNAYEDNVVKVNGSETEYKALKIGTSSKAGSLTLHIPAGTKTVTFYALSWNNKPATVTIKDGETEVFNQEVAANAGVAGNSPFTVADVTDANNFTISFEAALDAAKDLTVTTTGTNYRAIFFGIKAK
ncbi:MAG: hypothetical protein IJ652_01965 [Bacteroidales bacterium]|nr:hypothetical protein [Bacteroidales bacterium]